MLSSKLRILVTRAVFPSVIDRLSEHFDVESNPGDALWDREELLRRVEGKDGLFVFGSERIDAELLSRSPRLKIVANMTVGYNNFDVAALNGAGVVGTNSPDVLTETTVPPPPPPPPPPPRLFLILVQADFGFALLMATARRVTESERFLRAGLWSKWAFDMFAGCEVHGSTLGIIGMGRIGQAIAKRAAFGFGMKVIYHNRSRLDHAVELACQATYADKAQLLASADHVMLCLPYTPSAHHTIGQAELSLMKPTATLVNLARGGIVDDTALAAALRSRAIAAAGLDVFEGEPHLHPDLLTVPNAVLTPHIASATPATRLAMANLAADNLIGFLCNGKAVTPVNPEVLAAK